MQGYDTINRLTRDSLPVCHVLVDMSYALVGHCGISQKSRVLLKALHRSEGIEPIGLIFGDNDAVIAHRFVSSSQVARRIEKQALFLQALRHFGFNISRITPNGIQEMVCSGDSQCESWEELLLVRA